MAMTEKKSVWIRVRTFHAYEFDGKTPAEISALMTKVSTELPWPFTRLKVECGVEDDYDGYKFYWHIMAERLESDAEFALRTKQEVDGAAIQEKNERQQLEMLKEKYEA